MIYEPVQSNFSTNSVYLVSEGDKAPGAWILLPSLDGTKPLHKARIFYILTWILKDYSGCNNEIRN